MMTAAAAATKSTSMMAATATESTAAMVAATAVHPWKSRWWKSSRTCQQPQPQPPLACTDPPCPTCSFCEGFTPTPATPPGQTRSIMDASTPPLADAPPLDVLPPAEAVAPVVTWLYRDPADGTVKRLAVGLGSAALNDVVIPLEMVRNLDLETCGALRCCVVAVLRPHKRAE